MLAFQTLVDKAPNDAARRFLIAGKVEDMLNTVWQIIHNFEIASMPVNRVRCLGNFQIWMHTQPRLGLLFVLMKITGRFGHTSRILLHTPFMFMPMHLVTVL